MEFKTVKEALETLIAMNDYELNPEEDFEIEITDTDGESILRRKGNIKDLQQFNYEVLGNIADMLGMSELYLKERR